MDKKHICPYCGRAFDSMDRLAHHIARVHAKTSKKRSRLARFLGRARS